MTDTILVDLHDGYRVITINRPEKMNALNREAGMALIEALKDAEGDETCRAVILTGAGKRLLRRGGPVRPQRPEPPEKRRQLD